MLQALGAGRISAVELVKLHMEQIQRLNPLLNAVVIPNDEEALNNAQDADEDRANGDTRPLLGLPITVKDWIEVAGLRSTAGDPGLTASHYIAKTDAQVIAWLKAAGAIVLGKTNMAPWGGGWTTDNSVFGRSNNPWDTAYTPGGSTGGGAAAVAVGLSPLEIGNDLAGSMRIPAAFCGIYGHRPSESAWPRTGQTPDDSGLHLPNPATCMAVLGAFARSAEDLALILDLAAGPDQGEDLGWQLKLPRSRHTRLSEYRVAVLPPIPWLPVDDEIITMQERLMAELSRCGAKVGQTQPETFGDLRDLYKLGHMFSIAQLIGHLPQAQRRELASIYHEEARKRGDEFMDAGAIAFDAGAPEYIGWFFQREQYRAAYRAFFKEWDILISPATFTPPFRDSDLIKISEDPDDDPVICVDGKQVSYRMMGVYPYLAGVCGQPATVFPCGLTKNGLPVGLQAIGPYLEDHTDLQFASLVGECFGGYQEPPMEKLR
jgi:amidase